MSDQLTVALSSMPGSRDEFLALQTSLATAAEGGAAAFLLALFLRRADATLGAACLAESVDGSRLRIGAPGPELTRRDLQRIDEQLRANPGLPAAYIAGATPANAYALPEMPWTVALATNPYSGDVERGRLKLFVRCSGADLPRPVTVRRQETGLWKASEWSSLLMGIRRPA